MVMILVRDNICDNIYCPTPVVAELPSTKTAKQRAQPEEPTPTEIKQLTKEAIRSTSC
jgi:hypothetical protein